MATSQRSLSTWKVRRKDHPGSSSDEIRSELDWAVRGPKSNIGFKNVWGSKPGFVGEQEDEFEGRHEKSNQRNETNGNEKSTENSQNGDLMNWREAIESDKDNPSHYPEGKSCGWRYVFDFTEDGIKSQQDWPANIEKREKEEQEKKEKQEGQDDAEEGNEQEQDGEQQENGKSENDEDKNKSEYDRLREKYSPQQIALLKAVRHEKEYIANLKYNDGKGRSGMKDHRLATNIADDDRSTPDNWVPRSDELIRLTGKHPLNAEPNLRTLFDAGFITPNGIHYVRSHGAVPRLLWENHRIEITSFNGKGKTFSMDEIRDNFKCINIPVFVGCDNGRRKELNMLKHTTGFNWGPSAAGCAYWKGALLRDVLLAAGESEHPLGEDQKRLWLHLQGADNPGAALYETSIPFEYAMDPKNDVMLAYEMNDMPLPPDHGYPMRVVVPGYVGGRHVKWLQKMWVTDKENDSYYHIWDNRKVPSFVTSQDDELGEAMFHHPDTSLYEQYLNSIITRPSQGETIEFAGIAKESMYRIQGYAYCGRGDEVKKVEVTLDGGKTWLYCVRRFPEAPIRHGRKFWTWCFWHVDVPTIDLTTVESIRVRAWDVKMTTQPEALIWNVSGSMNNSQYIVKPEIGVGDVPHVLFRHPVEAGNGDGGWMKNSTENRIKDAETKTDAPDKQFTREEVEKHDKQDDCWIVVDGKVYDATSVMSWHPGGSAPIMMHAGAVHHSTSEEFASIHDDHAYSKLNECILGTLTPKALSHVRSTQSSEANPDSKLPRDQALRSTRWTPATLSSREWITEDTAVYTFALPPKTPYLGLRTCQHIQFALHLSDSMLVRPYTPTLPVIPRDSHVSVAPDNDDENLHDGSGSFQLTVKTYFPDSRQPGGAMGNLLSLLPLGSKVDMRGPTGGVAYLGRGKFEIDGEERRFSRVSLVLGGTGLTPGYSLIAHVALDEEDETEVRVVNANKTEGDILLREELERFEKMSGGRIKVEHVLSEAGEGWEGRKGRVDEGVLKECLFPPDGGGKEGEEGEGSVVLVCGPPGMIKKAVVPALEDWGYEEGRDLFGL